MKSQTENPRGLHQKYSIKKIKEFRTFDYDPNGTYAKRKVDSIKFKEVPVDKDSEYFVLRLDGQAKDNQHLKACRIAVNAYADAIQDYLPELAFDIRKQWPLIINP